MTTPLEALSFLSHQEPTPAYFVSFHEEINREKNDRGAAVLLGCHIELCLRYAIRNNLSQLENIQKLLFRSVGPLRSFEAKIRLGYGLGLFGPETKNNLDCIKGIRNAFAHAIIPITFDTPEVASVCRMMTMPEILPPRAIDPETFEPRGVLNMAPRPAPREIFQKICEATSHNLFVMGRVISRRSPSDPQYESSGRRHGPLP
ncbi:MAG TPA: hypothetical protein VH249_20585 [Xanthobacteraceae bacterium]|jgi:hypothetical protein|nr:hypothetical protein [Xanthobacteraceae bacterium]